MLSCRSLGLVYREEPDSLDREVRRVCMEEDETWQVGADFWELLGVECLYLSIGVWISRYATRQTLEGLEGSLEHFSGFKWGVALLD
jgi:hypothetical protein